MRLLAIEDAAIDSLCAEIVGKRRFGVATCAVYRRPDRHAETDIANVVAAAHSFTGLGDRWHAVERSTAIDVLAGVLARDLAYNSPILATTAARTYAERFVAVFDEPAWYLTNGPLAESHAMNERGGSTTWDPITTATFDTGVVIVSATRAGILWVEDED